MTSFDFRLVIDAHDIVYAQYLPRNMHTLHLLFKPDLVMVNFTHILQRHS